jgi:ureidoacrylate peracid hydrolase
VRDAAREAMMMDYATIMVDDALSAVTPAEHEHCLNNWMLFFGDVLSTEEVVQRLQPVAVPAGA